MRISVARMLVWLRKGFESCRTPPSDTRFTHNNETHIYETFTNVSLLALELRRTSEAMAT